MKYDLRSIMFNAWKIFRHGAASFSQALRVAWCNAKRNRAAREQANVTEEAHTWAGWKEHGYEVQHGSTALYKVVSDDPSTKSGHRVKSYFGRSQVSEANV